MKILKVNFLIATVFLLISLPACKKIDAAKGNKVDHTISQTGFTGIKLGMGGELNFIESATTSIVVNTTDLVFEELDIYVENSILHFSVNEKVNLLNSDEITITVNAPNITSLGCSGSGNIEATTDNSILHPNYSINVSGSGSVHTNTINSTAQSFKVSGSGSITADGISADNSSSSISGSGNIFIMSGTANTSEVRVSGSGSYQGFNLSSNAVTADVSGSGNAEVTANTTLNATISGSGSVKYKGNPTIVSNVSGSGNLIDEN